MRLFTAFDIPDEAQTSLSTFQRQGGLNAHWTSPEQYHVTLRFIGEVDDEQASRFEEALSEVEATPVRCEPYGLDVLPSRRSPSVLMMGLERTDDLLDLYRQVSDALEARGLDPEDRTYRPHVTIARLNDAEPEDVHAFLRSHEELSVEPFRIETFHLYESTLTPNGALHERRATFSLEA